MSKIRAILGDEAEFLLAHESKTIGRSLLHVPSSDQISNLWQNSDRPTQVLRSLSALFGHGRLAGTGYLSILPVDQGAEHTAGGAFARNPIYFDGEGIVRLAIEGGCNAVASTFGVLGSIARKYAHKIPFIVKINHNELLSYPNSYEQVLFGTIRRAWDLGAVATGATVYFGSPQARKQIEQVAAAFSYAHELGMATILWCYLRNDAFISSDRDDHFAADLTGQANYLGATLQADIIKQKLPSHNGGFLHLNYPAIDRRIYTDLASDHPIDLTRYQVANCFLGRIGLLSSGGASHGDSDLKDSVRAAVINKRAGGMGLMSGRKVFQHSLDTGVQILNAIQDVYLDRDITIA